MSGCSVEGWLFWVRRDAVGIHIVGWGTRLECVWCAVLGLDYWYVYFLSITSSFVQSVLVSFWRLRVAFGERRVMYIDMDRGSRETVIDVRYCC